MQLRKVLYKYCSEASLRLSVGETQRNQSLINKLLLGTAYNEFGYYEHLGITNEFFSQKKNTCDYSYKVFTKKHSNVTNNKATNTTACTH